MNTAIEHKKPETKAAAVRRELPFAVAILALCALSATMGAMIAAYQADGDFDGVARVARRHLGYVKRSLEANLFAPQPSAVVEPALIADENASSASVSFSAPSAEEEEEEEEYDDEEESEEDEKNASESTDASDRRRLVDPLCTLQKTQEKCKARAKAAQVPCVWRSGKCKFRPGYPIPQPDLPGPGLTLAPTPSPSIIQACIDDIANCPTYPEGRLLADWKVRYTGNAVCAPANNYYNEHCPEVCNTLFNSYVADPAVDWAPAVTAACQVGCGYAKNMYAKKLPDSTCHADCKNTVWHFDAKAGKCRYPHGLGLAVRGPPHPETLGAGKACEIGCLAANDRPCPACDKLAGIPLPSL